MSKEKESDRYWRKKMAAKTLAKFLKYEELEYEALRREHPILALLGFYR